MRPLFQNRAATPRSFAWGADLSRLVPGGRTLNARTLPQVGAAATGPLPICGSVYHAGAGSVTRLERERIQRAYRRLAAAEWIAYMGALTG